MTPTARSTTGFVFRSHVPGWLSALEARTLWELATDRTVLEIGSWKGRSTVHLAQTATKVFALDTFRGDKDTGLQDTLEEFLANLRREGVRDRVIPLVGDVADIGPVLRGPFGMTFVDGNHDDIAVQADTELAVRLTGPGSVLAWHDWRMPSVRSGIKRGLDGSPGRIVGDNLYVWER